MKQVAQELLKIAKSLVAEDWVLEYGNFSEKTELFFHSFDKFDHMLQALEKGSFGRAGMTSIGTEKSYVPYVYQIWFKPKHVKLLPVFYMKKDAKYSEILQELAHRFGLKLHETQVSQGGYEDEQEWYINSPVHLRDVEIVKVVYRERGAMPEQLQKLEELSKKLGFEYTMFPWE
jgi:hypothetical protein